MSAYSHSNTSTFRNRYLNEGYRGTAELGPVRFNATRAANDADLPHANVTRPLTATQRQPSQQLAQGARTQAPRPTSAYQPSSAAQARASWELEAARSSRFQAPQQHDEERYAPSFAASSMEAPRGVYSSPVTSGTAYQVAYQQPTSFQPTQSLSAQRLAQQAHFKDSIPARYALPTPGAPASTNSAPYYVPPYEQPPTEQFAPRATALGNKTYEFQTDDTNYPFHETFRGSQKLSNKPPQDPGQSIPYGRLLAEDAKQVRHNMSLASWDTFHVASRDQGQVNYNLSGLTALSRKKLGIDPENFCKWSISRRLPLGEQMRYHLPGYCGFTPTQQLRHGATYGKTTRQCIAGSQVGL